MTTERLKNIGLEKDVWKALKALAADRECTLSQAVAYLMKEKEKEDGKGPEKPDAVGTGKGH